MSERKTYWELLQDPRWQRRRLEIMNLWDFRCAECQTKELTLHVHHKLYRKGAKPWEYTDDELICLCKSCHENHTNIRAEIDASLARLPSTYFEEVLGTLDALWLLGEWNDRQIMPDQHWPNRSAEYVSGLARGLKLDLISEAQICRSSDDVTVGELKDLFEACRDKRLREWKEFDAGT